MFILSYLFYQIYQIGMKIIHKYLLPFQQTYLKVFKHQKIKKLKYITSRLIVREQLQVFTPNCVFV